MTLLKQVPPPLPPISWPLSTRLHSLDTTALLHFLPSTHYSENMLSVSPHVICFPHMSSVFPTGL